MYDIILDFSKAFDRVPHQRLMRKLDHYGIRGSTYNWIEAFLTDHTSACTSGRFRRFYARNWLPYAENPKARRTLTSP